MRQFKLSILLEDYTTCLNQTPLGLKNLFSYTGVWFTQVQITQIFSRWDCKHLSGLGRFLVYSGFSLGRFYCRQDCKHLSGLDRFYCRWDCKHLSGLGRFYCRQDCKHLSGLGRFLVYSGFSLGRFYCRQDCKHLSGLDRFLVYSGFSLDRFHCISINIVNNLKQINLTGTLECT